MRARKHFGQHFLVDGNVIRKIINSIAPRPGDHFVEIGPGRGAITLPLLAAGVRLDAIEIDHALARELPAIVDAGRDRSDGAARLTVHGSDALEFDFRTLAAPGERLRLAGNLPYNISTPLLFHLLEHERLFADLHVMLQKEVGERMTAVHGNKTYGRLTISIALRCTVERLFAIQPGSFRPPPQVDSIFLRLVPHRTPLADRQTLAIADRLVAQAFSMRRKRLSNGLRGSLRPEEIRAAGVDDSARPEDVPPEAWLRLAAVTSMLANSPIGLPE